MPCKWRVDRHLSHYRLDYTAHTAWKIKFMSKLDNANPEYLRIARGREALGRLAKDQTWEDWLAVGVAIDIGRQHAMRVSGKNTPEGKGYNQAFSKWLKDEGFDHLDKGDRKRLMDCIDHQAEIEEWRRSLTMSQRLRLNHPSTVWRRWPQSVQEAKPRRSKPVKAHIADVEHSRAQSAELEVPGDGQPADRDAWIAGLRDKTYKERAAALYQAMIELDLNLSQLNEVHEELKAEMSLPLKRQTAKDKPMED
jgi:hypothetical protein